MADLLGMHTFFTDHATLEFEVEWISAELSLDETGDHLTATGEEGTGEIWRYFSGDWESEVGYAGMTGWIMQNVCMLYLVLSPRHINILKYTVDVK